MQPTRSQMDKQYPGVGAMALQHVDMVAGRMSCAIAAVKAGGRRVKTENSYLGQKRMDIGDRVSFESSTRTGWRRCS
ncbi:uncharacterized protein BDZ99DRAFT_17004 [Mytilinidion resinicola]|uniref:Uncharacterized protein n=1 Tax=Mytilinidion resinicola TaxID=574789 RepID=A0A6A6ZAZ8_9PEZI|nr:uncharacterized protein BDZ99DRAFT_17004 [Mytilinidion resinicola]KAF2817484.1 hypothetical protein BDZ99DRAFT_17004 [Mytilinidion resinicola]